MPFIASWPGKIKAKTVSKTPIVALDVLGTLAAITNQKIEENQANDSASLLPILLGENNADVHPFLMTQSGTGKEGIIIKDGWKLIISFDKKDKTGATRTPKALFNLNENVEENEQQNLVHNPKYALKIKTLFTAYNTTRKSGVSTKI